LLRLALGGLALGSLAACSGTDDAAGQKRGPPQVGYVVVAPTAVPIMTSLGGRTVAYEESEVRPQVTGLLRQRYFAEGGTVRAGQPLFRIDPSLYQAAVNEASANLQAARATAEAAAVKAERFRPLAEMEAIAKQDYTDALATARQARAAVAQNAAMLETARINLRFTNVPAPISGRIGRQLATVGALVSANQAEPLAVIQRLDPIYVDMQQSSADLVRLRRALAAGGAVPGSTQVRLKLEDGSDYGLAGTVQFSEMMVNEATGTVTLRATFPNPQNVLLPGMFVQAQFEQAVESQAILVPQAALSRDFGGDAYVMLVGPDSKVIRRKVTADRTVGANWVVASGLARGDRVITQGTASLRHGMAVRAVPASTPQRAGARPSGAPSGAPSAAPSARPGG
jgi:membrane fusion protein (multidrug efflux system)